MIQRGGWGGWKFILLIVAGLFFFFLFVKTPTKKAIYLLMQPAGTISACIKSFRFASSSFDAFECTTYTHTHTVLVLLPFCLLAIGAHNFGTGNSSHPSNATHRAKPIDRVTASRESCVFFASETGRPTTKNTVKTSPCNSVQAKHHMQQSTASN